MTANPLQADPQVGTARTKGPIYLDYQSTTPADPRVVEAMLPFFGEKFGNPHSRSHAFGWEAEDAVEAARADIARLIGADPSEIIFTSGATEANNLALKGMAAGFRGGGHIVTVRTEHKCLLETCTRLEREGTLVTYLGVSPDGLIDLDELSDALAGDTFAVSVMGVQNEIGVVQPLTEIGALCRERGIAFHSDGAQAFGKINLDVEAMNIDLMSLSAHKVYGPKGVGALYVRRRLQRRLAPMIDGGGQERGLRSGTLPAPLCVGFGAAAAIAGAEMAEEAERLRALQSRFLDGLGALLDGFAVNGDLVRRIPGNLNLRFEGVTAVDLLSNLPGLAFSAGSACTSASVDPSYVLEALGLDETQSAASVRFGFGRFTTEDEIDRATEMIGNLVTEIRARKGHNSPSGDVTRAVSAA